MYEEEKIMQYEEPEENCDVMGVYEETEMEPQSTKQMSTGKAMFAGGLLTLGIIIGVKLIKAVIRNYQRNHGEEMPKTTVNYDEPIDVPYSDADDEDHSEESETE